MKNIKHPLKTIAIGCISLLSVLAHSANAAVLYATDGPGASRRNSSLYTIDTNSGVISNIGSVGYKVADIAWDRTRGKLYASSIKDKGLIIINTNSGAGTKVAGWKDTTGTSAQASVTQIDFDSKGNLFGHNSGLTHIDTSTGILTPSLVPPPTANFDDTNFSLSNAGNLGFSFDNSDTLWRNIEFEGAGEINNPFQAVSTNLATGITSPEISASLVDGKLTFSGGTQLQGHVGRHGTFDLSTDLFWAIYDDTLTSYSINTGEIISTIDLINTPDNGGNPNRGIRALAFASPVPVPAAVWLFGSGLIGLISFSKRQQA